VKIYTKTGDTGQTSLLTGGRVSKDSIRVTAYGDTDELNAVLGVVLATSPHDLERPLLEAVQRDLFAIGARLASPVTPDGAPSDRTAMPADRIGEFERVIDRCDSELPPLKSFIVPGGTPKAAALHHARTVCRRAERSVVTLHATAEVLAEILIYLNRLSDLLFVLARLANHRAGTADTTW
jgi:cob(I)alamin adenosyltransferase